MKCERGGTYCSLQAAKFEKTEKFFQFFFKLANYNGDFWPNLN